MKKSILIASFALLSVLSTPSFAARNLVGLQVTYIGTGWGAEGVYAMTQSSVPIEAGCGGNKFMIAPNHPLLKEMMALLLSAINTGKPVDLYVDGCVNLGTMHLKSVALHNP